jgi:hypothetical protein
LSKKYLQAKIQKHVQDEQSLDSKKASEKAVSPPPPSIPQHGVDTNTRQGNHLQDSLASLSFSSGAPTGEDEQQRQRKCARTDNLSPAGFAPLLPDRSDPMPPKQGKAFAMMAELQDQKASKKKKPEGKNTNLHINKDFPHEMVKSIQIWDLVKRCHSQDIKGAPLYHILPFWFIYHSVYSYLTQTVVPCDG